MTKKTVLVTGASRGIGRACALRFAAGGYHVFLNCRKSWKALHQVRAQIEEMPYGSCEIVTGDVGNPDDVKGIFDAVSLSCDGLDVLINNAGISYIGLLTDMTIDDWNQIVATNLTSVFSACRCTVPSMVHNKSGRIINISSVWGNVGASCEVAYSACKGGINSFTRALGKELAPSNITVNAIACGVIDTDMNRCFSEEERAELVAEIPAERMGQPQEVAELALSIASGHAYLNGQIITLDGGWI